jgi:cyclopropane fatty-acyl-phospholipid synthase-like methyltransferase
MLEWLSLGVGLASLYYLGFYLFDARRADPSIKNAPSKWAQSSHEAKVERFYQSGLQEYHEYHDGFLNFGFWKGTRVYEKAARALTHEVGKMANLNSQSKLLNVACGMGAETLEIVKTYKCETDSVDLCAKHIAIAQQRIAKAGITKDVRFHNMSATDLSGFAADTFSHVVCIEGGPFFMRRVDFMREAYRVARPGGTFCIADITMAEGEHSWWEILLAKLGAWTWNIPWVNALPASQLQKQMEELGFKDVKVQDISEHVFLGYYEDSWSPETISGLRKVRGRLYTMLGHIVDWFFYYSYHYGVIRYVIMTARKP